MVKKILLVFVALLCVYATFLYLTIGQRGFDTDLVMLSMRFTEWKVSLSIFNVPVRDVANYYNNYYVYFGPLASILLMPFVFIFGESVPQVSLGVFSIIVSFASIFLIAKHFKFDKLDSLWLSVFFVFSTVLFSSSVINVSAYQVEALGVPFMLLSLWAYFYKKPAFLTGLFLGLAVMTRVTLILASIFFFIEFLKKRLIFKQLVIIAIPIIIALLILGGYNNRRFNSYFETGYHYSITKNDGPIAENFKYGEINIIHVPANLYSFLLKSPEPFLENKNNGMVLKFPYLKADPWGIAIWFTSPLFLVLLTNFKKNKYSLSAGIAAFVLAIPVFTWYSIGFAQFGYRYALDFLPFLFLLLIPALGSKITKTAITLIIIGVLFNLFYSVSMWEIYPLFNIYS